MNSLQKSSKDPKNNHPSECWARPNGRSANNGDLDLIDQKAITSEFVPDSRICSGTEFARDGKSRKGVMLRQQTNECTASPNR